MRKVTKLPETTTSVAGRELPQDIRVIVCKLNDLIEAHNDLLERLELWSIHVSESLKLNLSTLKDPVIPCHKCGEPATSGHMGKDWCNECLATKLVYTASED